MSQLKRVRWAVRATLLLGVAASVVANVLHALDNSISQAIAAWPPLALLLTVELISRVPVHRRSLGAARLVTTAVIAGIAAWVSYHHMSAVALRYGETGASPYLLPLSVDGLIVVASICLVELGGRIRAVEGVGSSDTPALGTDEGNDDDLSTAEVVPDPWQYALPAASERPDEVANLSTPEPVVRKPHASAKDRVERAHKRTPAATNKELAERLRLSPRTVRRHRPVAEVNGRVPELAGVSG